MVKDGKIIGGIFLLFVGFYVLLQTNDISKIFGFALMGIGLYFILSNLK